MPTVEQINDRCKKKNRHRIKQLYQFEQLHYCKATNEPTNLQLNTLKHYTLIETVCKSYVWREKNNMECKFAFYDRNNWEMIVHNISS